MPETNRQMSSGRMWMAIAFGIAVLAGPGLALAEDFKPDPEKVEEGERVYGNYCQTCHGDNLVNIGQTYDLRRLKPEERKRFETAVQNGKNQMPPWKGVVSDADMEVLWHYIMKNRRS